MNRLFTAVLWMALGILCSLPAWAADKQPDASPAKQQRELIYCADYMTHEEREAYRARMRAARTPEEKAALRQAHQEEIQARLRERGIDPAECKPQRYRERLRLRGGKS